MLRLMRRLQLTHTSLLVKSYVRLAAASQVLERWANMEVDFKTLRERSCLDHIYHYLETVLECLRSNSRADDTGRPSIYRSLRGIQTLCRGGAVARTRYTVCVQLHRLAGEPRNLSRRLILIEDE